MNRGRARSRAGVVDLRPHRQGGALDEGAGGDRVAQAGHLRRGPVPGDEVDGAGGDRVEGLLHGRHLDGHAGGDPRQPAELDRLLQPRRVGAQERRPGADEGVEGGGPVAGGPDGDPPPRHPARQQLHRHVRLRHPREGGGVGAGRLDRQQAVGEGLRDGGVVPAGGLPDAGAAGGGPRGGGAAEGDAHAATAIGAGLPGRARPSSSARARTWPRRPGSTQSSSPTYPG